MFRYDVHGSKEDIKRWRFDSGDPKREMARGDLQLKRKLLLTASDFRGSFQRPCVDFRQRSP